MGVYRSRKNPPGNTKTSKNGILHNMSVVGLLCVQDFGLDVIAFQQLAEDCPPAFFNLAVTCCSVSLSSLSHAHTEGQP